MGLDEDTERPRTVMHVGWSVLGLMIPLRQRAARQVPDSARAQAIRACVPEGGP